MGEFIDMGTDNEVALTVNAHYSSITLSSSRAHRESPEIRTFFLVHVRFCATMVY